MSNTSKDFIWHFSLLMLSVFTLFFLTVGMGKASADLIIYMNDKSISKPAWQWVVFIIGAPIATAAWCLFWLFLRNQKSTV
ncbi:hypothetical protein [Phytopseudomonas punonensis]|uniref:hypothetical protein n=1 Tax=Phytopseudomonas punonensis TaxID=1220495 RepID=UPI0009333217|nr:hypothetical protein [Pseudomonas punonensis]